MKRIILLGIGAVCIPSLMLLGCDERSAAQGYDGGITSAAAQYDAATNRASLGYEAGSKSASLGYDGGRTSASLGYEAGMNSAQSSAADPDSSMKQGAIANANGGACAWEGGLSSR